MSNKLNVFSFSESPPSQPKLVINGGAISVRLDLIVKGKSRGVDQIGAAVLRMTQDDSDSETAKERRENMGHYVATLIRMHLERDFSFPEPVANRLCVAIDVRHGEAFQAPNSAARRISDIENACRMIAAIWSDAEDARSHPHNSTGPDPHRRRGRLRASY